jgi:Flp pilus assembly protein TadG
LTVTIETRKAAKNWRDRFLGERGAVAVEFAILAPALLLLLLGTAQFGLTLNQYVMLSAGSGAGAMQFSLSGGIITSACATPCPATAAWKAIIQNAPVLKTGTTCAKGLCVTLTVNGTPCTTSAITSATTAASYDSTCNSALTNKLNYQTPALLAATYPCDLIVMQYNFFPSCQLQANVAEYVP